MSSALEVRSFVDALEAACVAAWSVAKSYVGKPLESQTVATFPYSVIAWQGTEMAFQGVGRTNSVEQSYTFDVVGRFKYPTDSTLSLDLEAADRASELIAAIQTGPTFATYGYLPLVTRAARLEGEDEGEEVYGVHLTFSVKATADHS